MFYSFNAKEEKRQKSLSWAEEGLYFEAGEEKLLLNLKRIKKKKEELFFQTFLFKIRLFMLRTIELDLKEDLANTISPLGKLNINHATEIASEVIRKKEKLYRSADSEKKMEEIYWQTMIELKSYRFPVFLGLVYEEFTCLCFDFNSFLFLVHDSSDLGWSAYLSLQSIFKRLETIEKEDIKLIDDDYFKKYGMPLLSDLTRENFVQDLNLKLLVKDFPFFCYTLKYLFAEPSEAQISFLKDHEDYFLLPNVYNKLEHSILSRILHCRKYFSLSRALTLPEEYFLGTLAAFELSDYLLFNLIESF